MGETMTLKHRYLQASAERRGAVLPLAAIGIVFFIAMVAFAIDIGYIAVVRTELQSAADAAALASAAEMYDKAIITSSQASVVQKYKAQQAATNMSVITKRAASTSTSWKPISSVVILQIAAIQIPSTQRVLFTTRSA